MHHFLFLLSFLFFNFKRNDFNDPFGVLLILFLINYHSTEEQAARGGKSWGEIVEEAETRVPGHGVHMHEKLSSPSRKR